MKTIFFFVIGIILGFVTIDCALVTISNFTIGNILVTLFAGWLTSKCFKAM